MSATNAFETSLLGHIFQNSTSANVGDATGLRGSSTAGVFYISLHTATPGETGDQTTNEAGYGSYARKSIARDSSNWTVSGDTASNTNTLTFDQCTGSSATITFFGIGSGSSGAGNLFFYGTTNSLSVSTGITPSFAAGALDVQCD